MVRGAVFGEQFLHLQFRNEHRCRDECNAILQPTTTITITTTTTTTTANIATLPSV